MTEYQTAWLLMAANASSYLYSVQGGDAQRDFARQAFRDFIYYRESANQYLDPAGRVPTSYRSIYFVDSESKIHGWSGRYGQYYLRMERQLGADLSGTAARNGLSYDWRIYP